MPGVAGGWAAVSVGIQDGWLLDWAGAAAAVTGSYSPAALQPQSHQYLVGAMVARWPGSADQCPKKPSATVGWTGHQKWASWEWTTIFLSLIIWATESQLIAKHAPIYFKIIRWCQPEMIWADLSEGVDSQLRRQQVLENKQFRHLENWQHPPNTLAWVIRQIIHGQNWSHSNMI